MRTIPMAALLVAALCVGTLPQKAYAAGEGSLLYNLAAGGACYKLLGGTAGLICGFGSTFAEYVYTNRRRIMYLLAWSGGRYAKVTTPCIIANGVKYYCL